MDANGRKIGENGSVMGFQNSPRRQDVDKRWKHHEAPTLAPEAQLHLVQQPGLDGFQAREGDIEQRAILREGEL